MLHGAVHKWHQTFLRFLTPPSALADNITNDNYVLNSNSQIKTAQAKHIDCLLGGDLKNLVLYLAQMKKKCWKMRSSRAKEIVLPNHYSFRLVLESILDSRFFFYRQRWPQEKLLFLYYSTTMSAYIIFTLVQSKS